MSDDEAWLAALDAELGNPDVSDVRNVRLMPYLELLNRKRAIKAELQRLGEVTELSKTSRRGRDLHHEHAAILVELERRHAAGSGGKGG